MNILISQGFWGVPYAMNFCKYCVSSLLSKSNIPDASKTARITLQIITDSETKKFLENRNEITDVKRFVDIQYVDLSDVIGKRGETFEDLSDKYFKVSLLQTYTMRNAKGFDYIIFNYADFVWAEPSITNLVELAKKGYDAVLGYVPRVDEFPFIDVVSPKIKKGRLSLKNTEFISAVKSCLHKEVLSAFWNNEEEFTYTPSAIFWDIPDSDDFIISAYHKHIYLLKVNVDNPLYYNGIIDVSLDGFYTAVLTNYANIYQIEHSSEVFAVSLTDEMPSSRFSLTDKVDQNATREYWFGDLLKGKVANCQRQYALNPIIVSEKPYDGQNYQKQINKIKVFLEAFHKNYAQDDIQYISTYGGRSQLVYNSRVGITQPSQKRPYNHDGFLEKGLAKLAPPARAETVLKNGRFSSISSKEVLKVEPGAWWKLPVNDWLGHFDFSIPGTFQAINKNIDGSQNSLLRVAGEKDGQTAWVAQRIKSNQHDYNPYLTQQAFIKVEYIKSSPNVFVNTGIMTCTKKDQFSSYETNFVPISQYDITNMSEHKGQRHGVYAGVMEIDRATVRPEKGFMFFVQIGGLDSEEFMELIDVRLTFNPAANLFDAITTSEFHMRFPDKVRQFITIKNFDSINWLNSKIVSDNHEGNTNSPEEFIPTSFLSLVNHVGGSNFETVDELSKNLAEVGVNSNFPIENSNKAWFSNIESLATAIESAFIRFEGLMDRLASYELVRGCLEEFNGIFIQILDFKPDHINIRGMQARCLWNLSRFAESIEKFSQQNNEAQNKYGDQFAGQNYLPLNTVSSIGLIGHLDGLLKRDRIQNKKTQFILYKYKGQISANDAFLDLYRDYIDVVEVSEMPLVKEGLGDGFPPSMHWVLPNKENVIQSVHEVLSDTYSQWSDEGRNPLVRLSGFSQDVYESFLKRERVSLSSKKIAIHIRSAKYYNEKALSFQSFRNSNMSDFFELFQKLIEKDYTVFVFNDDPEAIRLVPEEMSDTNRLVVVPYNSDHSDHLHISIIANADLYVSTASGLNVVAHAFDKSCVYTNFFVREGLTWRQNDFYAPKLYYSIKKHRILTFEEIIESGLSYADHGFHFDTAGVTLLDLSPEDHVEIVFEAIQGSQYEYSKDSDVINRRIKLNEIKKKYNSSCSINFSSYILKKYGGHLIGE